MEIQKELRSLVIERGLVKQGPLENLKPTLAIDGEWLLESKLSIEQYYKLLGGKPLNLESALSEYLSPLISKNIKPVIVLQGISVSLKPQTKLDKRRVPRAEMWEKLANSDKPGFEENLKKGKQVTWAGYSEVVRSVRALGGEVFRAPYHQSAQLEYLSENNLVGGVMGPLDLLFSVPKQLVLSINKTEETYDYVDSNEVLQSLGVTREKLVDAFVLKGYLFGMTLVDLPFEELVQRLQKSDAASILDIKNKKYFEDAKNFINAKISLATPGLHFSQSPNLQNILKIRLPDKLYFALSVVPLSSQLFTTIASSSLLELPPYADSDYYISSIKAINNIRKKSFSLLAEKLPEEYKRHLQSIKIRYYCSSNPEHNLELENLKRLSWHFDSQDLESELLAQTKEDPDILFCLKWHYDCYGNNGKLTQKIFDKSEQPVLESSKALKAKVLLIFLEHTGYFSGIGKPMLFGKVLLQCEERFQYPMFYILELYKLGYLNSRTLAQEKESFLKKEVFEQLVRFDANANKRHSILLVSRVFSLLSPTLSNNSWTGPLDYDLAQFHCIVSVLSLAFQSLTETIVLCEYLDKKVADVKHCIEVTEQLPFGVTAHVGLGIAVKHLLMGKSLEEVRRLCPEMKDLEGDLRKGWEFWKSLMRALKIFVKFGAIKQEGFKDYVEASKILKRYLIIEGFSPN